MEIVLTGLENPCGVAVSITGETYVVEAGMGLHLLDPTKWDGKSGEAIIWKASVPLPGKNSPIVWNDRVFLSGANKQKRQVFCFDACGNNYGGGFIKEEF